MTEASRRPGGRARHYNRALQVISEEVAMALPCGAVGFARSAVAMRKLFSLANLVHEIWNVPKVHRLIAITGLEIASTAAAAPSRLTM